MGDTFGYSVAISGETVVVGAIYEASSMMGVNTIPNELGYDSGAAYVFTRSSGSWTQQAYLKASNTGRSDSFGTSVAIAEETLVVGAKSEDSATTGVNSSSNEAATDSGAAYVFTRSSGSWNQQAYLKASNPGSEDYFGNTVAISGETVVIGAFAEGSSGVGVNSASNEAMSEAGAAYVFARSGTTWSQQTYLKAS